MDRLTEKKMGCYLFKDLNISDNEQKLGRLEDIEEELGIELLLLFKITKADKIYNKFFNEIQEWTNFKIDIKDKKVWYSFNHGLGYRASRRLSDYGKTWTLTEEELI